MSRIIETFHTPLALSVELEQTAENISVYFLELEGLLDRIERSTSHYQILGLERSASYQGIRLSYQQALVLLYPPYSISETIPPEMISRIERAFNKISLSFFVLATFNKRKEYDLFLASTANKPAQPQIAQPQIAQPQIAQQRPAPAWAPSSMGDDINMARVPQQQKVYAGFSKSASDENRRRAERFRLPLPARVTGYDRKSGKWHEMTETVDVSRSGITIKLHRRLLHGMIVYVTLPFPVKLRSHGYADSSYSVYALVRRVEPLKKGTRLIGLEFLGEHPPAGYLQRPWAVFRTKKWNGIERRRMPREDRTEVIRLEYFSEDLHLIMREEARTENVSRTGLRVAVKEAPPEFDLVRVSCKPRGFESLAAVRNRYVAQDGCERLCLQLIDKEWPI